MIKSRKQLRGVTALLGLEYRGKAAFIFACFQRQTVLYFEESPPAICSLNLRILRGHHRRAFIKPSGNLLLESSDSAWVPPEDFYKILRQSAGIGALRSGDGSTGELL